MSTLRTRSRTWGIGTAALAITGAIAFVIVLGIVLVLLGANSHNPLVNDILRLAGWFAKPFRDLFPQHGVKQNIFVNWGIGALVYLFVGGVIARLAR